MGKGLRDRLTKQREDLKKSGQGGKFFTIKEGVTRVRHLPTGEEKEFAKEVVYFYLGNNIKGVVSPATFGEKCAIMNEYNRLSSSKSPEDREFSKKFKPQRKFFSPVIKYKDDKGKEIDAEAGVKPLILTSGMYQELIDLFLDDDEAGDFTNVKSGYDIKYSRTGKGKMDTEYSVRACKPTAISKEYKGPYDIDKMVKDMTPSYKETKELLEQFLNLPPEEDEAPKKSTSSSDKKKKKKNRDL